MENKVAIITGGAGGIGSSICSSFVSEGTRVVIADVDYGRSKALADELGDYAVAVEVDVKDESSVKAVVDAIRNFVKFSEPDSWDVPDQKDPSSVLSARVKDPTKAHLGQDLSDEQIQIGMKFLETGKRWKWIESGFKEIKIEDDFGNTKTQKIPNRIMVEVKDSDPHYNSSLRIYKKWGSPYGRTAPANMFFRIALSGTGWRKQEAVTAQTQELASYPADEDNLNEKLKSGQKGAILEIIDKNKLFAEFYDKKGKQIELNNELVFEIGINQFKLKK